MKKDVKIKPIKTKKDHEEALELFEKLMDMNPKPGSDESNQMGVLAALIENYESKKFPEILSDPIEAIKFRMDQTGMTQADLLPYFGSKHEVSEVLSGKKPLTLEMIRKLKSGLDIPADVLIQTTEVADKTIQPQHQSATLRPA